MNSSQSVLIRPLKRAGQARGPRKIDGALLGIPEAAAFLGLTPKAVRGRVARALLPYRKMDGRIVFIREELCHYIGTLPGITLEEAVRNAALRRGEQP